METAKLLSYAFHPLVVTAFGFLAFCLVKGCPLHSFVTTETFFALIPYLITLSFKATGRARSVMLEGREERLLPITLSLLSYLAGVTITYFSGPPYLLPVELGYIASTVVILITTLKFKVSVHVSVYSGFSSVLTFFASPFFAFCYLLVPLVAWARLKLRVHTVPQVVAGLVIGAVISPLLVGLWYSALG